MYRAQMEEICYDYKDPQTFRMLNKHGFNFKLRTALASNKSQSVEALKPGIDFSYLARKVLDDVFFQYKDVLFTLKICF